jgi:hypothetical protein
MGRKDVPRVGPRWERGARDVDLRCEVTHGDRDRLIDKDYLGTDSGTWY